MKSKNIALAFAGIFLILGLFRINDLSLYTDSTRYLIWGHSLSEFKGFVDDTQPIHNRFVMNAPLYPVLLVPAQWIFPFSVEAAKVWTLLWGCAAAALFFLWFRKHSSTAVSASFTLLLLFNPLFLTVSTEVLSEAPFMALAGIILLLADEFFGSAPDKRARIAFLVCIAVIMLLREMGAAFVVAAVFVLFRQKRGKDFLLAGSFAGTLFLLWTLRNSVMVGSAEESQAANVQYIFRHFVTSEDASLVAEFFTRAWLNFKGYAMTIGGRIFYPFPETLIVGQSALYDAFQTFANGLRIPLFLLAATGAVIGIFRDLRSGASGLFRLVSLIVSVIIILFYPVHDIRFFLPLLPFLFFYLARFWDAVVGYLNPPRVRNAAGSLLVALLLVPNATAVWEIIRTNNEYRSDPAHFRDTSGNQSAYFDQPWSLIGGWIRDHCPEDAVIASPVKEIVPFVYPRPVLETSRILPTPVFERYLRDFEASYLLTVNAFDSVETFQYQMPESRRLRFIPLTGVAGTAVYEIHSAILDATQGQTILAADTTTTRGLLIEGRKALMRGRYHDALGYFERCLRKSPSQPEIVFQIAVTLSFLGDSVAATTVVEQLFTLPRSTAYLQSVRSALDIMQQTLKAKRLPNASQQSFALFETALAYWGLGYGEAARSVIRDVVRLDATNFVGALWGIHMAKELGDTLESNQFLNRLKRIDRSAQIVGDWEEIRSLGEALGRSTGTREPAGIHLALSRVYAKIELFDEAVDETLRALKLEPTNIDAWLYKGELMEKKKATWGAAVAYRHVLRLEPHNSYAQAKIESLKQ